jgi:hypothetical protein
MQPKHLLLRLTAVVVNSRCKKQVSMSRPPPPHGGQEGPPTPADAESVNSIVRALYEAVSFAPGGAPDWDRVRALFFPGARVVPPPPPDSATKILDVESFIARSQLYVEQTGLSARGFYEIELDRHVDSFGNIAHVLSSYESRHTAAHPTSVQRGVNSIQLLNEDGRWWVVSALWDIKKQGHAPAGP